MKRSAPYPTFRYWLNDESGERVPISAASAALADTATEANGLTETALTGPGKILIGNTTGPPTQGNIQPGSGIDIVDADGAITVNSTLPAQADGEILIGSSGTPVAGTLTAGAGIEITNAPGAITVASTTGSLPAQSDGQLLIGDGGTPVASTLTAGTGISVTNGPGSVTIDNTAPPYSPPTYAADRSMITDPAGVPTAAAAQADGEVLIGATGGPPVASTLTAGPGIAITNTPGVITIAQNLLQVQKVTSATTTTTDSLTDGVLADMTITMALSGDYLVFFDGLFEHEKNDRTTTISLYLQGVIVPTTSRGVVIDKNQRDHIGTMAYVTSVTAGDVLDVRWKVNDTDFLSTAYERSFIAIKLA